MGNIKRDVKGNVIIVKITDTITIDEYISFADMYNINDKYVTNNELFFDENRSDDLCIKPKEMYLLKENNMIFSVVRTDDNLIKITQKTYTDDDILENSIEIDTEDETYKIIKIEHDKDGNTKVIKIYSNSKKFNFFKLDKKEALDIARDILININNSELSKYVDISYKFNILRIRADYDYNYEIENDTIALSTRKKYKEYNKGLQTGNFDIILKDTKEHIGNIEFDSHYEVSYYINENFRKNHYATSALNLLIKLLKQKSNNKMDLSLVALNKVSEKVIKNNGGIFEEYIKFADSNYPMYSIKI